MTQQTPLFDSLPSPERHIRRLETIATLLGRSPKPVTEARVLDIGCGLGALLLALAVEYPNSTFVGVDYSNAYLEKARTAQKALGVTNVTFVEADISAFSSSDGTFDYILAHGVFSWAGNQFSRTLLARVSSLLSPSGVAAVSFNPWPGFHQRDVLKRAIAACTKPDADAQTKVETARKVLKAASHLLEDAASPVALALKDTVNHCQEQADRHLLHSLLMPDVSSISLSEFVGIARGAGLSFLADARPINWKGERYRREYRSPIASEPRLDEIANDDLSLEFALDLLAPASFRVALLTKEAETSAPRLDTVHLSSMRVSSSLARDRSLAAASVESSRFYTPNGGEVSAGTAWFGAILAHLEARWPDSVPVEELKTLCPDVPAEEINSEILTWYLKELLDLEVTRPTVSGRIVERPVVHPLARYQAGAQEWVTTYRHGYAVLDHFSRATCSLCDGSRSVTAIATTLVGGKGGTLPDGMSLQEIIEAVRDVLATLREQALLSDHSDTDRRDERSSS